MLRNWWCMVCAMRKICLVKRNLCLCLNADRHRERLKMRWDGGFRKLLG